MIFAMSGSQRTGKTTLAKRVAECMGFHYHDAATSKFAKEFGVNAVGDLSLDRRIDLQEYILKRHIEEAQKAPRPAVTDRCPLDMIGYMLGEVTMHNTPVEAQDRVNDYVKRCLEAADKHFAYVAILRPLPVYIVDPKSPPPNIAYQTLVQMIIEGARQHVSHLPSSLILSPDPERRLAITCTLFQDCMSHFLEEKKQYAVHG